VIGIITQLSLFLPAITLKVRWTWLRAMSPLKILRNFRFVDRMRALHDLRVIMDSLADAGHSMLYATLMVGCIMLACSLVLLEGVANA